MQIRDEKFKTTVISIYSFRWSSIHTDNSYTCAFSFVKTGRTLFGNFFVMSQEIFLCYIIFNDNIAQCWMDAQSFIHPHPCWTLRMHLCFVLFFFLWEMMLPLCDRILNKLKWYLDYRQLALSYFSWNSNKTDITGEKEEFASTHCSDNWPRGRN